MPNPSATPLRIAILTNMQEFRPGYSLTGIIKDQVIMLNAYGHDVHLFVNTQYHDDEDTGATLHKSMPFCHLHDFQAFAELEDPKFQSSEGHNADYYKDVIAQTAGILTKELQDFDFVFTHDFIFTGWFMPYGQACIKVGQALPHLRWLHWVHSMPGGPRRDYWDITKFGKAHRIVYPNSSDKIRVAEAFNGTPDDVRVIPHIKDLRTWFDFDIETYKFIDDYPMVAEADIVQIYPAAADRLDAKRVREVILIFARLKKAGRSVCLVIANQWATTVRHKQNIENYIKIARRNGLTPGKDVIFTSEWQVTIDAQGELHGKYEIGLPKRILRELMQYANLFIFPTREESFGLVLPEASLAGGVLCVLNKSLLQQIEVSGFTALYFDFGSVTQELTVTNEGTYFQDIATLVIGRMLQNESIMTKTFMRQTYNWNRLYRDCYAPILAEAEIWI